MNTYTKLQFAFFTIILLFSAYGGYSIYKMDSIGSSTVNIFNHPLAVSKATLTINTEILQSSNAYLLLLQNHKTNNSSIAAIQAITKNQLAVKEQLKTINNRYLGPIEDIQQIENLNSQYFTNINQALNSPNLNQEKLNVLLAQHIESRKQLLNATQVILDFASNKANQFLDASTKEKFSGQIIGLTLLLLLSISVSIYIIKALRDANKVTVQQLYTIDQNILSCELDLKGNITTISNALARAFNEKSADLVGKNCKFFIESDDARQLVLNQITTGKATSAHIERVINEERLWFEMRITPQLNADFEVESYQAFFTDITSEKRIEEVSIKDSLTGLYNRNYFELVFGAELKKAKRDRKHFAMIMLDVDFFKQYNDNYGHVQGDYALKAVASAITKCTQRSYDIAFRVGGEEFFIIFDIDSADKAAVFCEKVRNEIESLAISHDYSEASDVLTASIGACVLGPDHLLDENQAYKEVDQQLYMAKKSGRNNVQLIEID